MQFLVAFESEKSQRLKAGHFAGQQFLTVFLVIINIHHINMLFIEMGESIRHRFQVINYEDNSVVSRMERILMVKMTFKRTIINSLK